MEAAFYYRKAQDAEKEISKLQDDKARCSRNIADANKKIATAGQAIIRASNNSTRSSKQRDIEREQQKIIAEQKRIGDIDSKIAKAQQRVADARRDAQREEARALEKQQREAARVAENQRREADNQRRERERKDREVASTLARHETLHQTTRSDIEALRKLPEKIVVLVLAANPAADRPLQLDEEVRLITTELRASEYRDVIRLESRWAVRPLDILQAINEIKPTIVHFIGHGTRDGYLAFQGDNNTVKRVSIQAFAETMQANEGIKLVFLNACFSIAQAQAVVPYIPAAIGMTDEIEDKSARIFAAKFYSAIGFGHSVKRAYQQARAALLLEDLPNEEVVFLVTDPAIEPDDFILVRPANIPSMPQPSSEESESL